MSIANYLENRVLDAVFNNTSLAITTPYVALNTADPGETGASEVTGGSYARQSASFGAAASGAVANDAEVAFTGMPAVTVSHVSIWDAASGGNCLWTGPLASSKVMNAGDTFRIPIGDLDVTLD